MNKRSLTELLVSLSVVAAAVAAGLTLAGSGPRGATTAGSFLTSWEADPDHFSPDGNGVQDSTRLDIDLSVAPAFLEVQLRNGTTHARRSVLFADTLTSPGLFTLPWNGDVFDSTFYESLLVDIDTVMIGDSTAYETTYAYDTTLVDTNFVGQGKYDLFIRAGDLVGTPAESESVRVVIDNTRPALVSYFFTVGDTTLAEISLRNGETLNAGVVWSESIAAFSADLESLDTDPGIPTVTLDGDTTFFLYTISSLNMRPDAADIPIRVTASDLAGNKLVTNGVTVCLSNLDPQFVDWEPLEPWRTGFHNGENVRILTYWSTDPGADSTETVSADYSEMDSGAGTTRGRGSKRGPGEFLVTFRLSAENTRPDGSYRVTLLGGDANCGETTGEILLGLDNTKPTVVPTLDPLERSARTSALPVSGHAAGVFEVIMRVTGPGETNPHAVDSLTVDAGGDFAGTAMLAAGDNLITFHSMNRSGNLSAGQASVDVFLLGEPFLGIPKRFRPGDEFSFGFSQQASRVDVEIRNLAGETVTQLHESSMSEYFELPWDGRNRAGQLAFSGPYLALIEIEYVSGERETHAKPFIFTRE
jgi:hypothetical protein